MKKKTIMSFLFYLLQVKSFSPWIALIGHNLDKIWFVSRWNLTESFFFVKLQSAVLNFCPFMSFVGQSSLYKMKKSLFIFFCQIIMGSPPNNNVPNGCSVHQPIKLFQVVSILEFHEYQWNNHVFIFLSPWVSAGPQKPLTLIASKTKYEKFWPKI